MTTDTDKEDTMSDTGREPKDETHVDLEDLDTETVEDLDVNEDADEVHGGTIMATGGCPSMGCPAN